MACRGACAGLIKHGGPPPSKPNAPARKCGDSYEPWGYCSTCCGWVLAPGLYCFCCHVRLRRRPTGAATRRKMRLKAERRAERPEAGGARA